MKVIAEFEKPKACNKCPCFYQTEGAYKDYCQLTGKEIKNYFVVDSSCPLKEKESEIKNDIFPEITLPEGSAELVDKVIVDAEKRLKEIE
ncbi:hypothetical protein [Methanobrevibacter sp.]|uniref:hypothetical protein n=1 Tax=Methanobrevibacter sp. TaxID=66852 RepID=UPI00386EE9D2